MVFCYLNLDSFVFAVSLCYSITDCQMGSCRCSMSATFVALNLRNHIKSAGERWFLIAACSCIGVKALSPPLEHDHNRLAFGPILITLNLNGSAFKSTYIHSFLTMWGHAPIQAGLAYVILHLVFGSLQNIARRFNGKHSYGKSVQAYELKLFFFLQMNSFMLNCSPVICSVYLPILFSHG